MRALGLALAVVSLLCGGAEAQTQPSPRAALHGDYGRIVFDWPQPVKWTEDLSNDRLILHFERPVSGDPVRLVKPLAGLLTGAEAGNGGKDITLKLKGPVTVKSFATATSTVFDITPAQGDHSAPAPAPAAVKAMPVTVRAAQHEGFNRVVFEWPRPVGAQVMLNGQHLTVTFDRIGALKLDQLAGAVPHDVKVFDPTDDGKGTVLTMDLPEGMGEKHFVSGAKLVLDLVKGKAPIAPPMPPVEAKTTPEAPPPPSAAPPTPEVKVESRSAEDAPSAAPSEGATLPVQFDQPSAVAVFNRAGWWWLVFERKGDTDAAAFAEAGGSAILHVDAIPSKKGAAYRMLLAEGLQPMPRKVDKLGKSWEISIGHRDATGPVVGYPIERQMDFADRGRIVLKALDPSREAVVIRDPEVGDTVQVVPVGTAGAGVRDELDTPDGDLLQTIQGIAMVPHSDRAWLDSTHGVVQMAMPGGLTLSKPRGGAATPFAEGHLTPKGEGGEGEAKALEPVGVGDPIDLAKWVRGGFEKFDADHAALVARALQDPPGERGPANLDIARHYVANGLDAEALGTLRAMEVQDPAVVDQANFRAVRGIASMLLARYPAAMEDFSHPSLSNDRKAAEWLAAAKLMNGASPASQAAALKPVPDELKGTAVQLRMALGRPAVLSALAVNDIRSAARGINAIDGPDATDANKASLAYLGGMVAEANRQPDEAVKRYLAAEAGKVMQDRALAARNRIEIQFKQGKITSEDAIHQLQRLPFVWHGNDFAYQTSKRAALMLLDVKRYREGFEALRAVQAQFNDNPDAPNLSKIMTDQFVQLFHDGGADAMQPITAIGLFNEYQDLLPPGELGDEMIRKLADRLAAVDLLDEAAELLEHQVKFRLTGADKLRVATRLAFLDLANRKPHEALDVLDVSETPPIPPELQTQRRIMRVQALADLGRTGEALGLLINDTSDEAKKLRADIYWGQKRWSEAATAIEAMTDLPAANKRIDPVNAKRVVDIATALTLARDERGLARLRKVYGPSMRASAMAEAFDLLTSAPEHGIMDYHQLPNVIKQAEDFQTFMGDWRKRTKDQGLSSLN